MRHGFFLAAFLSTTLLGATTSSIAYAEPSPQDIAQARDLGGQAQAAFDAGKLEESEKLWIAAGNLFNAPTLTLGLARTQAKLGKLVVARESYNKMIREHGDNPNLSPAFKDALEAAKTEVNQVSARIGSVVITVEGAPNPQVSIDGQNVPAAALGLKRPIDPGNHVVKAEAQGFKTTETPFQLADGGLAEMKLTLEKEAAPVAGGATPAGDPGKAAEPAKKGGNKTPAYVAFGVGGVGLVLGGITGAIALGKHGTLADKCPDDKCAAVDKKEVDAYRRMATLSTVGFVVGGLGIAAGAVLWLTAGSESTSAATAAKKAPDKGVEWHPYVGVGGGGVTGRF